MSGCGQTLTNSSGEIKSPGFPCHYYNYIRHCTHLITAPDDHVVQLTFEVIDIETCPSYQAPFDTLKVNIFQ